MQTRFQTEREEITASGAIGTGDDPKTGDPVVEVGDRSVGLVKVFPFKFARHTLRYLAILNGVEVLGKPIKFSL
ncbi:MAG: hypothetical protein D6728_15500 [Cyanobacteria bacterium J055]|nr:MAG: hypothetical protein D6728_15500 [Cyanobacteria bacterium J055]